MRLIRVIGLAAAALALCSSSAGSFQIVVPSCYLLGLAERHFIEYRDHPVPEQQALDVLHKYFKDHPDKLSAYADPQDMISLYEKMIKETYGHPGFDVTDMMIRFSAEGYCIDPQQAVEEGL